MLAQRVHQGDRPQDAILASAGLQQGLQGGDGDHSLIGMHPANIRTEQWLSDPASRPEREDVTYGYSGRRSGP